MLVTARNGAIVLLASLAVLSVPLKAAQTTTTVSVLPNPLADADERVKYSQPLTITVDTSRIPANAFNIKIANDVQMTAIRVQDPVTQAYYDMPRPTQNPPNNRLGIKPKQDSTTGEWSLSGTAADGTGSVVRAGAKSTTFELTVDVISSYAYPDPLTGKTISDTMIGVAILSLTIRNGPDIHPGLDLLPMGIVSQSYTSPVIAGLEDDKGGYVAHGLPSGLVLSHVFVGGVFGGLVSGVPQGGTAGFYVVECTRYSVTNDHYEPSLSFGITIVNPLVVSMSAIPQADEGIDCGVVPVMRVVGGTAPYLYDAPQINVPDGMVLDLASGTLSGTPSCNAVEKGPSYITDFLIMDSSETPQTFLGQIVIDVAGPVLTLAATTALPPAGTVGVNYDFVVSDCLAVSGVCSSISWTASGLPLGLVLARVGGIWRVTGAPGAKSEGTYRPRFQLTESDAFGSQTLFATLTIIVNSAAGQFGGSAPTLLNRWLPDGVEQEIYTMTLLRPTGGTAPYSFTIVGLPSGLALNTDASGNHWIAGTPDTGSAGEHTVAITVADSAGVSSLTSIVMTVLQPAAASDAASSGSAESSNATLASSLVGGAAGCAVNEEERGGSFLIAFSMILVALLARRIRYFTM